MKLCLMLLNGIHWFGIPLEFYIFALTLTAVALFHHRTLEVALTGLSVLLIYKIFYLHFPIVEHIIGSTGHHGEWSILLNLFGLLTGFAILADHFEESHIPKHLPNYLPSGWKGCLALLAIVFVMSSFLDNIAAAIIGGSIAHVIFKGKVHIGYIAAIVAASNAGGAGSVLGDTTTTMMWIDGVSTFDVLHAYAGSISAFLVFGILASRQQQAYHEIIKEEKTPERIDFRKVIIVLMILAGTIATNVLLDFPAVGVWIAILAGALFSKTPWNVLPDAIRGSIFLLSLVLSASLMPVEELPQASWQTAFALGFVSSVFDNIPLTKLALDQMGYDWGVLAFTVGFGGSMIWFGSSAGVALSGIYPQIKSVGAWIRKGWYVAVAYIIGFFILLGTFGWHPHDPHKGENKTHVAGQAH